MDRHELQVFNERTTEAQFLRWALWLVYKFRVPGNLAGEDRAQAKGHATETGLAKLAELLGAPKALLALEMERAAEEVAAARGAEPPPLGVAPSTGDAELTAPA